MVYLVTGGGGFIGSNLAEALVSQGGTVRVLDNFSAGKRENLRFPGSEKVEVIEGDIRDIDACRAALKEVDFVFHEAALGSVPRSIEDPRTTHDVNITGTLNVLIASRYAKVKRFVFASSSSVYGDIAGPGEEECSPKNERMKPAPLSPYGISKLAAEEYCRMFYPLYGLETVSLRYFNVFGPRQSHLSEYAAVIPRFIEALLTGNQPTIYGDGGQSRDFTFVRDVVNANLLAATVPGIGGEVLNIACNRRYSLLDLVGELKVIVQSTTGPRFAEARQGDIRHSMADIGRARKCLGFEPAWSFRKGLEVTVDWYRKQLG
jgi:UDP-N-acetylglucosamine/UDP-N-acetylgalactosamine 4-epimerase